MSDVPDQPVDLKALLRLQERDVAIDQLTYRREHLPAHLTIADLQKQAGALRPELTAATAARDEVGAQQAALEAEIEAIQARIAEINSRLYGTAPISPKDAQAMVEEVKHLTERRTGLEDTDLEVMELLEPLALKADALEAAARELSRQVHAAQGEIAIAQQQIDDDLIAERAKRDELAGAVPVGLLSEYDRLRPSLGGVAVVAVVGSQCGGCHLTMSSGEMAALRKAPVGTVIRCEECGRIVVLAGAES